MNTTNDTITSNSYIYTVRDGDTLEGISIKFNIRGNILRRINHLCGGGHKLYPGQILNLRAPSLPNDISPLPPLPPPDSDSSGFSSEPVHIKGSPIEVTEEPGVVMKLVKSLWWSDDGGENAAAAEHSPVDTSFSSYTAESPVLVQDHEEGHGQQAEVVDNVVLDDEFDAEIVSMHPPRTSPAACSIVPSPIQVAPVLVGDGAILRPALTGALAKHVPITLQADKWILLYSVLNDGADLTSFYGKTAGNMYTILVVETMSGEVFGGFASASWHVSQSFYGTGESFIFCTSCDEEGEGVQVYRWTMENDLIMWSCQSQVAMGGGGDGFGFVLDADFLTGQSNSCTAFGNPPLTSNRGSFRIANVEVW
eukprot:CAMPEP_0185029626 /NCGR_PEP_ID=MMETSP1103-20130426/16032_1 /TAXON_ID=36769 /ORGANISM="Paraphysomonas bandaiensis, Strain Caron Lab Isolate" /LENGTH=365 /DNA_ID=CAMNT_0027564437 /DNA_START=105 /DNA_END=1199 /DNA_ORIENTATION=+